MLDTFSDFNLMDEIFYDGFWLDGSNIWQPHIDDVNSCLNTNQDTSFSFDPSCFHDNNLQINEVSSNQITASTSLWVMPNKISVKNKLVQAVNHLQNLIRDQEVLIQIWVPVKTGGRQVLTTKNQHFTINSNSKNLQDYRVVSGNYQFAVDGDSKDFVGLPGRVFLNKLPEWTPDVRFFKREEYPRIYYAQQFDVRGSLALPVFEHGSGQCLGVVEIITTSQKVNHRPELENVCKALEAVDLKSSTITSFPNNEVSSESYLATISEIQYVLKCVCEAHKLPLAQTWTPCIQEGKGGRRHSDENYSDCVSTLDAACYVADSHVSGFHEACSEHHLIKGEGIAGKAFLTNKPCFAEDITAFSKTEYPLSHHARVFNLRAAVAMRFRSTYTGMADFVLEFFLPLDCKDVENQRTMLDSLSSIIQQTCKSLRIVTNVELDGEKVKSRSKEFSLDSRSWITDMMSPKGKGVDVSSVQQEEPEEEFKLTSQWNSEFLEHDYGSEVCGKSSGSFFLHNRPVLLGAKTNIDKRRVKTEKTISLQVLRQYFAGSLKDAAKSIGVCPTTLKRICRQHGITRWPSRKIKKVGHSLQKLQLVIDSVQGAEGSIQLSSFYNNFPELVSPNVPGSSQLQTSTMSSHLQTTNNSHGEGTLLSPGTTNTASSSGSHSSGSGYFSSMGVKQSSCPGRDALSEEQSEGMLKRARSVVELHEYSGLEDNKVLVHLHSRKDISYNWSTETPLVPKTNGNGNDTSIFRVKATYGEENIRLSLLPQWTFKDLRHEVLRRFNMDNRDIIDLKYLDDDSEWVLLTCDADLEECIDIHRSSKSRTIKISLNQSYDPSLGSSFGSNGPF